MQGGPAGAETPRSRRADGLNDGLALSISAGMGSLKRHILSLGAAFIAAFGVKAVVQAAANRITPDGRRMLAAQRDHWREFVEAIARITGADHA